MGGGKTPVAIAFIEHLLDEEEVEAGLLIVPSGLKRQWLTKGFEKFAPDARVMMIDGSKEERIAQYEKAREWAEYIIIGYDQLVDDWRYVRKLPKDFVVADEVQAIKSFEAQRTERLKELGGGVRLGLTGQPLENFPEDIFSICEWIDPTVLGRFDLFDACFIKRNSWGKPVSYDNLPLLRERLEANIMVRFSREEIEHMLPERESVTYLVPWGDAELRLYRHITRDLLDAIEQMTKVGATSFDLFAHYGKRGGRETAAQRAARGRVMSRLTCLRMLCDHVDILRASAAAYGKKSVSGAVRTGSAYAHELQEKGLLDLDYGTPKFDDTLALIHEILAEDPGRKIAVFSFFKQVLRSFQEALPEGASVVYSGDVSLKVKQQAVDAFNDDPRVRVFLSSDAGGAGVDLPSGTHHINFNLPFSAGQLEQRDARIDRIANENEQITIINQLMEDSVEEYYYEVLLRRRKLAEAVVDGRPTKRGQVKLSATSLREFLVESPLYMV